MNSQALMIPRMLFLKAVEGGPVETPVAIQEILRDLPLLATAESVRLNTAALEEKVSAQFSIREVLYGEQDLQPEQAEQWVNTLRWVVQELKSWTPDVAHASLHLRIVLAALAAFDAVYAEIDVISQQFTTLSLPEGLCCLLEHAEAQKVGGNSLLSSLWVEIQAVSLAGDYERLSTLRRHFGIDIPFPPDMRLAILLLWRMKPSMLAKHIDQKKDAFLSYGICCVLRDSAYKLALDVDDVTFKFFSAAALADMREEYAPSGAVEVFRKLLLQVARSDHWASWLHAFFKYPGRNWVSEQALPDALAQLDAKHWSEFVNAVELWTHLPTVAPVTNLLVRFYKAVGASAASEMWRLAYRRWDSWDYGRGQDQHMSAPAACSFDFPVAMHYAIAPDEAMAEKERLIDAIAFIDQTWFSSQSDLITQRNRLLSRLRLVCHGQALASGVSDPLPPPVQPDSEYAALRYKYFDVNSRRP